MVLHVVFNITIPVGGKYQMWSYEVLSSLSTE